MDKQAQQSGIGRLVSLVLSTVIGVGSSAATASSPSELTDSPLTLAVVAPSGAQYRLAYAAGQGWRFVDGIPDSLSLKLASNGNVKAVLSPTSDSLQPQAVFIDGPTGYTFVWVPEGRWQFVGHVAIANR